MNTLAPVEQAPTSAWSIYRAIVGIGILCALLIVTVYQTTAPRIRENQERFLAQAILEVLPAAQFTVAVELSDDGRLVETADVISLPVFLGYDEKDDLVGAAVTAEGMGYQDTIRVLYAYSFELAAIVGFKILDSKETAQRVAEYFMDIAADTHCYKTMDTPLPELYRSINVH